MDFQTAQVHVVQQAANDFNSSEWVHAIIDFEILEFDDGYDTSSTAILILRDAQGNLNQQQFFLSKATVDAAVALYRQRKDATGETIGGFVLKIDQPGRYKFEFNHGQPKKLTSVWDAEWQTYLDNYLAHFQREQAASQRR